VVAAHAKVPDLEGHERGLKSVCIVKCFRTFGAAKKKHARGVIIWRFLGGVFWTENGQRSTQQGGLKKNVGEANNQGS